MAKTQPFEEHSDAYENWFVRNKFAYLSELHAIKMYLKFQEESLFYKIAIFYSVDEIVSLLRKSRFYTFSLSQTIFHRLRDITDLENVKKGYGKGSFVVIQAMKN